MDTPLVSVVIATRNRPAQLGHLLSKLLMQDIKDFECIVVDDGSDEATLDSYAALWQGLDARFRLHSRPVSGGPSVGRNEGVALARARYIAFCDDDDYWVRTDHLSVAIRTLTKTGAELYLSNMHTTSDDTIRDNNWYRQLLNQKGLSPLEGEEDVFHVQQEDLAEFLKHRILHANTLVVERSLLDRIGGYWEKIRFAEDHDLSFRLADAASGVLLRKTVTANLDVSPHPSLARTFDERERLLFGITAVQHAETVLKSAALRKVARQTKAWKLLELAKLVETESGSQAATGIAWQAMLTSLSRTTACTFAKMRWQAFAEKTKITS